METQFPLNSHSLDEMKIALFTNVNYGKEF